MWLNPKDHGVGQRLNAIGYREPAFMWILRHEAGGQALDVGANIGYCTISLAEQCDHVYALEPDKRSRAILRRNVKGLPNVTVLTYALAEKEDVVPFKITKRPNLSTMHETACEVIKTVDVVTVSLDHLCQSYNIEPNFIKMDIEGAEVPALHGGWTTLAYLQNIKILMEVHPAQYSNDNNFCNVMRLLLRHGYRVKYVVNAKGKRNVLADAGAEVVKTFKDSQRAVFKPTGIEDERLIALTSEMPADGKKVVRALLFEKNHHG